MAQRKAKTAATTTTNPAAQAAPRGRKSGPDAAPQSKQAQMLALLRRRQGATLAELVAATGWQAHSVRGALSGTVRKKLGLAVTAEPEEGRGRVYRLGPEA